MKIVLAPRKAPTKQSAVEVGNEALRLAAEIAALDGRAPKVDFARAELVHWNGARISLDQSELEELAALGLIDDTGAWSERGRRELARQAEGDAAAAAGNQPSRSYV